MIGTTLANRYRLVRLLGEGGMGRVFEAHHMTTRRRVAVKVMNSRVLSPGGARRFRREARATGIVESEHIAPILDSGEDEPTGLLYLVMEYLKGEDLQQLVDRCGPIAPDAALRIAAQALAGLTAAHEARIVHRDIKPANLFLTRRNNGAITVKLLDFGIAKVLAGPAESQSLGLTSTGGLLGSPLYMSPEQVDAGGNVDHRTDIWSLGSALYCALAGAAPHRNAPSVSRLLMAICAAPPPPLLEVAPWVSPEIARVVHRALELRPEDRYPSAAAMLEALRPLLPGGSALREDMLAPVHGEPPLGAPRLQGAESREEEPTLDGESTADLPAPQRIAPVRAARDAPALETPAAQRRTAPTAPSTAPQRPTHRRALLTAAVVAGASLVGLYRLTRTPAGSEAGACAGFGAGAFAPESEAQCRPGERGELECIGTASPAATPLNATELLPAASQAMTAAPPAIETPAAATPSEPVAVPAPGTAAALQAPGRASAKAPPSAPATGAAATAAPAAPSQSQEPRLAPPSPENLLMPPLKRP